MRSLLPACTILLLAAAIPPAHASTITQVISFTASGQVAASGSYTLTYDPTKTYTDATAGLTINSFNDTFPAVPTGFSYTDGYLAIGGLLNSVYAIGGGTADFFVTFGGFPTSPYFGQLLTGVPGEPNVFYEDDNGTVTVTNQTSVTPEPSSLVLLGSGLLTSLHLLRRRLGA